MTVNTGISTSLRRPQVFHSFTYLQGGRSLTPLPQRTLLIGTSKGGTANPSQIYPINDPIETDALFGVGSQLALMCRQAFKTQAFLGAGPQLFACGVAESAGLAKTETFTFTGPATGSGVVVVRIAGRTYSVGVSNGDSVATMATALAALINADKQNLPLTATPAAGVVTMTHNSKGLGGNDVVFEVVSQVSTPAGVTCIAAAGVAGTVATDETAALAAAAGTQFDTIALENNLSADVALALAHVTAAWTTSQKFWRWVVIGSPSSIGTGTTLAAAANDRGVLIANCNGCLSLPGEMAAAYAVALTSRSRPNANLDGLKLPLYPPYDANAYTATQIESALAAGLTPLTPVVDPLTRVVTPGVVRIEKAVTTQTTYSGQPFEPLRDIAVSRTGAYLAQQIDAAAAARFGADANPDGALLTDDAILQVRDMVCGIMYAAQDARIITNFDTDKTALVVEKDLAAPGRVNIDLTYTVVLGMHQMAFVHRVTI